jgi:hypothetical protein
MGQPAAVQVRYFDWLYGQIEYGNRLLLCERMHQWPFLVIIAHDENRIGDVQEMRGIFINSHRRLDLRDLAFPDATIFEVLVCLARKAEFQTGIPFKFWFWKFMENLLLDRITDDIFARHQRMVDQIIERFNTRTYEADGRGGIFPLRRPRKDQRYVELWYQMAEYLTENNLY